MSIFTYTNIVYYIKSHGASSQVLSKSEMLLNGKALWALRQLPQPVVLSAISVSAFLIFCLRPFYNYSC